MFRKESLGLALASLLALAACNDHPAPVAESPFRPTASIQELMQSIVDPSADALWESVSSTTTKDGVVDKVPQSDAEWIELRHLAIRIAESGNLLSIPGRPIAHSGKQLEDSHIKGILSVPEIQARLDQDPALFRKLARDLQLAAETTLTAIDAKNIEGFLEAGSRIDQACEQCHLHYWYPNDKRPTSVPVTAIKNPLLNSPAKP